MNRTALYIQIFLAAFFVAATAAAQNASNAPEIPTPEAFRDWALQMSGDFEEPGLAEPFKGITSDGAIEPGLFRLQSTGLPTDAIHKAANDFLAVLTPEQRERSSFAVDDEEWRKWMNTHFYVRQGVSFSEMSRSQHEAVMELLGVSLSAKGLKLSQDIMRLNTTLAELNNNNFIEYGEDKYHMTVMGTPSATEPWGWQLDGHHLIINYFVLGDQVVMAPVFWGSEPTIAESGRYEGTAILQEEQAMGLAMLWALNDEQRQMAVLSNVKTTRLARAEAFRDNVIIPYEGVPAALLDPQQKRQLRELMGMWIYNLREDQAAVQMSDIEEHLDATYFAWIGGSEEDSVYYYRIHSPVILIEFDHFPPVGLPHLYPPGIPYREHIHTVVRVPNGNDYGKDLLQQHWRAQSH